MFGKTPSRFNSTEYINWLKASYCLKLLKDGLHAFTSHQMKGFHTDLLNRNCGLKELCKNFCRTSGTKVRSTTPLSSSFPFQLHLAFGLEYPGAPMKFPSIIASDASSYEED